MIRQGESALATPLSKSVVSITMAGMILGSVASLAVPAADAALGTMPSAQHVQFQSATPDFKPLICPGHFCL